MTKLQSKLLLFVFINKLVLTYIWIDLLEQRAIFTINLENSELSRQVLTNLLKYDLHDKDSIIPNESDNENESENDVNIEKDSFESNRQEDEDTKTIDTMSSDASTQSVPSPRATNKSVKERLISGIPISFDHIRCTDCTLGHTISQDCANNLKALQQQALYATSRLQILVELRERMYEVAETLDLTSSPSPSPSPTNQSKLMNKSPTNALSSLEEPSNFDDMNMKGNNSPIS